MPLEGSDLVVGDAGDAGLLEAALALAAARSTPWSVLPGSPSGPWDSREHWDDVIRIDLTAPYEALRVCWPALVTARGSAVLVGSIVGAVEGSLRSPAYAAAKAGLEWRGHSRSSADRMACA